MNLKGKAALVTGGSRGIGRAVSIRLAGEGAFVFVNYARNEEAARETLRLIGEAGGEGKIVRFDVADTKAATEAIAGLIQEKGRIDILVNNAGESRDGLLVRMKEQDWDRVIGTNLKGAFNCCRAVSYAMMKQRGGRIINVSSVVALSGNAGQANYSASKAGIIGLTKSLARELGAARHLRERRGPRPDCNGYDLRHDGGAAGEGSRRDPPLPAGHTGRCGRCRAVPGLR